MYGRSRPDIDPTTPWSEPKQLFPPMSMPSIQPHAPDEKPEPAVLQEWKGLDQVQRDLRKFYANKLKYTVTHIPDHVQKGTVLLVYVGVVAS